MSLDTESHFNRKQLEHKHHLSAELRILTGKMLKVGLPEEALGVELEELADLHVFVVVMLQKILVVDDQC